MALAQNKSFKTQNIVFLASAIVIMILLAIIFIGSVGFLKDKASSVWGNNTAQNNGVSGFDFEKLKKVGIITNQQTATTSQATTTGQ